MTPLYLCSDGLILFHTPAPVLIRRVLKAPRLTRCQCQTTWGLLLWLTPKNIKCSYPDKLFQLGCWEDTPALISFGLKDVATVPNPYFLSAAYGNRADCSVTTGVSKESRNQLQSFYKSFWSLHFLFPLSS